MGIFDFVLGSGDKIFGGGKESDEERSAKLENRVRQQGLGVQPLRIDVKGDVATVTGKASSQQDKEMVILVVGNTQGIAKTFTRDVTLHLGDEEISVVHVDPAHTDGDSFVRFRKANFLHMGDCYLNGSFPVIDSSSGGLFSGTIAAADTALGMLDSETRIIRGHGPIASGADLRKWRDMLATILERVKTSAGAGKTLDQVKAERRAKEWEESFPRSFATSDHAVEEAYREAAPR